MRRFFYFFIVVAFLLRGFMGDAMAVTMGYNAMNPPTTTESEKASPAPSCHEMTPGDDTAPAKATAMSHTHCQLCCAVIVIPSADLLTFDQTAFFARPVGFTPNLASNDLLPAFKPPIL